jgi:hypothetical protein
VREHEAGGTRADDADLCAMIHLSAPLVCKYILLLVALGVTHHQG